jgi:hypothetical protein
MLIEEVCAMLMLDPFRHLDRLAGQMLGTVAHPAAAQAGPRKIDIEVAGGQHPQIDAA